MMLRFSALTVNPGAVMSARDKALNAATFVVVGDGLAAGAGDFGLCEELQPFSFPALAARQIGPWFAHPIVEAPVSDR